MEKIQIKTLVDITNSGVPRYKPGMELQCNQYKNWITLLQGIGLRCIIEYDQSPIAEITDMRALGFGEKYRGENRVWTFTCYPDREQAYANDDHPLGLLIDDLHQVPIIEKLTETINIHKPVFETKSRLWRNTAIKLLE